MVSGSNIFSLGGTESAYLKGKTREKGEGDRQNPQSFGTDRFSDLLSRLLANRQELKNKRDRKLTVAGSSRSELAYQDHSYVAFNFYMAFFGNKINKWQYKHKHSVSAIETLVILTMGCVDMSNVPVQQLSVSHGKIYFKELISTNKKTF